MKKFLCLLMLIILAFSAKSQYVPMNSAGYQFKGVLADTLMFATGCGAPVTTPGLNYHRSAIYYDTCGSKGFYVYDPPTFTWNLIGSGDVSFPLFVDTLFPIDDSTFRWCKGSVCHDILIKGGDIATTCTGTLTDVTFTDGSGFDGTVTGTTTKAISLTTSLTQGSVPFIGALGALTEDNAHLFYDNANDRLGVGINTPASTLHVEKAYTLNGTASDRMVQFWATITSDNGTADRYPRGVMSQLTTAGSTDFDGPTEEIIAWQGQTNLAVNVTTNDAYGGMGRVWGSGTNYTKRMVGLEGEITVSDPAVQTTDEANGVRSMFLHQGGTLNAGKYFWFNATDSNRTLVPTTINVDTSAFYHAPDIDFGTVGLGFWQQGSTHPNIFEAASNIFPNLPNYSTGGSTTVVWNNTTQRLELGTGDGSTGITSESDPVSLTKTVSLTAGTGISITGTTSQALSGNPSWTITATGAGATDTVGVIDVAGYILSGAFGTDTTAAVNQAGIDASNSAKKTIRFSSAVSNYVLKCHYRIGSSSLNRMGFEVPSGVTVIVDKGATVTTDTAWTVSTSNGKIYPLFNSIGRSNITYIINGEIAGQKTTYGTYTTNPNTNPNGYDTDSTHRWSNSGIQAKDCDNITIKGDGYIHDFQAMGIQIINTTRADVSKIRSAFNGSSGIRYFVKSTGRVEDVTVDHNTSDNVRFDSCYYHIGIYNSHISWSGYGEVGSSNGFANIYTGGDTKGLDVVNCDLHDAQSYNLDLGSAKYTHVVNPTFSYGGNGAIVTIGYLTVDGGELKNNGKRTDGTSDPASNYNNGGIVMNNAVQVTVTGTTFTDTASGYQDYVVTKNWGGGGSAGYTNCDFVNCKIKGASDTAHIWNGNIGHNNLSLNKFYDLSGNPIIYGTSGNYLQLQSDGTWKDAAASSGGVTTMSAFTTTSNATGATISGSNLQMTGADTTNAGEVSVSTAGQYFLGPKFFSTGNNGATPGYWTRGIVLINRNTAFTGDGGRTSPSLQFNTTGTHSNGGTAGAVDTAKWNMYADAPVGFNGLNHFLKITSQTTGNAATVEMNMLNGNGGVAFAGTVGAGTTSAGSASAGTFFGAALTSSSTITLTTAASQELKYLQGTISRGKFYADGNYIHLGTLSASGAYPGTEQDAIFSLYSAAIVGTGTTTAGGSTVTALTQAKNYWKIGDAISLPGGGGETKTITAVNSNTQVTISGTWTNANTNAGVTKTAIPVFTAQANGLIGIGTATPAAFLDIQAGTANFPQILLHSSTLLTTPVDGAVEYDGTHMYITIGGVRKQLDN